VGLSPAAPVARPAAPGLSPAAPVARPASSSTTPAPVASGSAATAVAEHPVELDEATQRCWQETLVRINARKRMLGAFLEESRFLGCAEGKILMAMDDLHRAVVEEKENRALVAEELLRAFGRPLELRCLPADPSEMPQKPAAGEVKEMVARTVAWFGGEAVAPADR
jgi:hypothetical protein